MDVNFLISDHDQKCIKQLALGIKLDEEASIIIRTALVVG